MQCTVHCNGVAATTRVLGGCSQKVLQSDASIAPIKAYKSECLSIIMQYNVALLALAWRT